MSVNDHFANSGHDHDKSDIHAGWDAVIDEGRNFEETDVLALDGPEHTSLVLQTPEKKYSVESSQQFSQYLSKESSSRYGAIVLKAWTDPHDAQHFEVGLVNVYNADHRNGVIHVLRVAPIYVDFVALDEAFFEYMHSHIYDAQA